MKTKLRLHVLISTANLTLITFKATLCISQIMAPLTADLVFCILFLYKVRKYFLPLVKFSCLEGVEAPWAAAALRGASVAIKSCECHERLGTTATTWRYYYFLFFNYFCSFVRESVVQNVRALKSWVSSSWNLCTY